MELSELQEVLEYYPEYGVFRWKITPCSRRMLGDIAGCTKPDGYRILTWKRKIYYVHRLVWLFHYGTYPLGVIDHINGDKGDNRILNLRDVSISVNGQNQKKARNGNRSGFLGVSWNTESSMWVAQIGLNGKTIYLGRSNDKAVASHMYMEAKRKLHEGCTI